MYYIYNKLDINSIKTRDSIYTDGCVYHSVQTMKIVLLLRLLSNQTKAYAPSDQRTRTRTSIKDIIALMPRVVVPCTFREKFPDMMEDFDVLYYENCALLDLTILGQSWR